ncbi:choline O-acetyltransferase-like [Brevipalpus obovatus]|uniref:choline O-acetyltransferase-like n=1 Tax=Brevipalpus obovatus TaxID=246614 RepID=UPI003D9DE7C6
MSGGWKKDLPKPPVPELKDTLERYLSSLRVVLPSSQYEITKNTVENFEKDSKQGPFLQKLLQEYAKNTENWVTDLWLDDMYMNNPLPLPINSSPFCLFPRQNFRTVKDFIRYAARIVCFTLKFKEQIDNELLTQEHGSGLSDGKPLCMQTYKNFFKACRVPGHEKDHLTFQESPEAIGHIIVASRNQFFRINLTDTYKIDEEALAEELKWIWNISRERESTSPSIGILTADHRKTWASVRAHLMQNSINKQSLQWLETSLFTLCLDDSVFQRTSSTKIHRRDSVEMARMESSFMAQQLMHGGGVEYYSANRFYDKFLQILVGKDGICGIIFEHSASEGITVLRFADQLLIELEKNPISGSPIIKETTLPQQSGKPPSCGNKETVTLKDAPRKLTSPVSVSPITLVTLPSANMATSVVMKKVQPLVWQIDKIISQAIEDASKRMNKLISDVDLVVLDFDGFGKNFIKDQSLSPDAFIQLALQLTYYKVHRKMVSSYESASLRQYRSGRVDSIRSNTVEALTWARALCDEIPNIKEQHKIDLFHKAMRKQVEIAKYTVDGYGPDNHLLGLREMAKKNGQELPLLFREKAYKEYLNFKLSTSQLVYDKVLLVGYGAVVPDGYGCSYRLNSNSIIFCITSFFSSPDTGSNYFAASLEGSLLQMRELCAKIKSKESTKIDQDKEKLIIDNSCSSSSEKISIDSSQSQSIKELKLIPSNESTVINSTNTEQNSVEAVKNGDEQHPISMDQATDSTCHEIKSNNNNNNKELSMSTSLQILEANNNNIVVHDQKVSPQVLVQESKDEKSK